MEYEDCKHTQTRVRGTYCYTGSVAGPRGEENRAAHGGVREELECADCGARASRLVNGRHVEQGPWRDHRAEVERARGLVTRLRARVREVGPRTVASDNCVVRVSVGQDGLLDLYAIRGAYSSRDESAIATASGLVDIARDLRIAVLEFESLS